MLPLPSFEDIARKLVSSRRSHDSVCISCLYPWMINTGLDSHPSIGNSLVELLIDSGNIHGAQLVFDKLISPNLRSWNALIGAYNYLDKPKYALALYRKLQAVGSLQPTGCNYVGLLKACKILKDLEGGLIIHSEVASIGLLKTDSFVGSALLDFYSKCGLLWKAQQVFDQLPVKDVVTWTALIGGYVDHKHGEKALECFNLMQKEGFLPNSVTFISGLKACGSVGSIDRGQDIHAELGKKGLLDSDVHVCSSLVDMYAKCGFLSVSKKVLETFPSRNAVLWNALIAGYTDNGLGDDALACLEQMHLESISPDSVTLVLSLKACGILRSAHLGQELHAEVERKGLLIINPNVGNTLVDLYTKCGLLDLSREVFDNLPVKDVVSWTALIEGYAEQGRGEDAIKLFEQMQLHGVSPNHVTAICCLKASGSIRSLEKGEYLHAYAQRHRLLEDIEVGNSLIDMYAKCEQLQKSQEVFDKTLKRNVVTWNTLLAGYCEHGQGKKVLERFQQMQYEDVVPTAVTFLWCLKSCAILLSVEDCMMLHMDIEKRGFLRDLILGNVLVDTYAKCNFLSEALHVLERLPVRDVVTWSTLISEYCQHGFCYRAFELVNQMQLEGHSPDTTTLVCILKACILIRDMELGREIHADIERQGLLERDILVGSALIDMYAKCEAIVKAMEVFDRMLIRNEVSWNALIMGLAVHGHSEETFQYLGQMEVEGVSPDAVTFIGGLVACTSMEALGKGRKLHVEIERRHLLEQEPVVGSVLVDFYAKCGLLIMARQVFDKLLVKSVAAYNALIRAYVEHGDGETAIECFEQMLSEGVFPDDVIYVWILKACCILGSLRKGQDTQAEIERRGLSLLDVIGTALVSMYAEFGLLRRAQHIFDNLPARDHVSWNALMTGYVSCGHGEKALLCLDQMEADGVSPDAVTMLCSLKACGLIGAESKSQTLHTDVEKFGLLATNYFVGNTLLGMYASCGSLARAQRLFDILEHRDVVTWNVMMFAYVKHGLGEEALKLVTLMQIEGVCASAVTYICSLKACGSSGAWDVATAIHAEIERRGLLETEHYIGSTLVDLYAKWGCLVNAQDVCDKLPLRSAVPWTAMMKGYAQLGESKNVFRTCGRMLGEGILPDAVTFAVILSACDRLGFHSESQMVFGAMTEQYGIMPTVEHHNSVVSLLSRIAEVERVSPLTNQKPMISSSRISRIVSRDCMNLGKTNLEELAFGRTVPPSECKSNSR